MTTLNDAAVSRAFAQARLAQPGWAALPYADRSAALRRVRDLVVARADELAAIISADNGKTLVDAMATEVVPAVLGLEFYRKAAGRLQRPQTTRGGSWLLFNKRGRLHRVPYGVVGIISPWNYPFSIPFGEVVMGLLMGNAVVLKVASDTLKVGEALAALFRDAGLPDHVFTYVVLPGSQAGPAFLEAGCDKLFFTGSTEVGRTLAALAAPRLTPLVLELGGNDAAVVLADADLDRAAAGILWSGFSNAGQSCGGAQRVYVHRSIHDAFVANLGRRIEALRVGPGDQFDTDMGPLTSTKQKRTVEEQIAACVAAGARVAARSAAPEGERYLAAVVLTDVPADSPVLTGEVFGPVVAVVPFDTEPEAVGLANRSPMGLTASVWSQNHRRARILARSLRAGAVLINDHLMSHGLAETPWGGFGDSGIGRTHGLAGLEEMAQLQVIVDDLLPGATKNLWWHPYSKRVYEGIRALLHLLHGNLGQRLGALGRLATFVWRYWER